MDKMGAARNEWEAETQEDTIEFKLFKGRPQPIRRHKEISGGLAMLHFGWEKVGGDLVEAPDTVYFAMIVSEVPGDGRRLLSRIKVLADKYGLAVVGEPTPIEPLNWEAGRHFSYDKVDLENWYETNGFGLEDVGNTRRVRYPPMK